MMKSDESIVEQVAASVTSGRAVRLKAFLGRRVHKIGRTEGKVAETLTSGRKNQTGWKE